MSVLGVLFFSIAAVIFYLFFYWKTHDVLNPPGVMTAIWLFLAGICHLNLGIYQQSWCTETYIAVVSAAVTIVVTGNFMIKKRLAREQFKKRKSDFGIRRSQRKVFYFMFYVWVTVCLGCALLNIYENHIPLTYVFTHKLEGNKGVWHLSQNTFVKYFTCMLPHCGIISFYIILFKKKLLWKELLFNILIIVISVYFTLFIMCSRGTALILLLGFIYIAHRKFHFSITKLAGLFLAVLAFFGVFALFRWSNHSSDLAVYSGKINSPLFNSIYNYIVYCYQNLDTLIRDGSPLTVYKYNLPQISKILGLYQADELRYISVGGFNACTYLIGAYHDLGLFGVVLYSALDTFIVTYFYNLSNRNEIYTIPLAMFQRGIMTLFFGEYIFLVNGQSLPIAISLLIILVTSRKVRYGVTYKIRYEVSV